MEKAGEAMQSASCWQGVITNAIARLDGKLDTDNLRD
jgi:hypothetical protein